MDKYVGKYRVVCEFDRRTLKPLKGDNYIYCAGGGQIYRYSDTVLVYYKPKSPAKTTLDKLELNGIPIVDSWLTSETEIKFEEKYLDRVAIIVKARTLGANIKPHSKANLKLFGWYKERGTV